MKTADQIFEKQVMAIGGASCLLKYATKDLGLDLVNNNMWFFLCMEAIMNKCDETKEYGDCDPDAGKSWTYDVPVYCYEEYIYLNFEGGHHFSEKSIEILVQDYDDEEEYEDVFEPTEDHIKILQYLDDCIGMEGIRESENWTGDPYKDNGVSRRDFI